jgi:hypothetical protein
MPGDNILMISGDNIELRVVPKGSYSVYTE